MLDTWNLQLKPFVIGFFHSAQSPRDPSNLCASVVLSFWLLSSIPWYLGIFFNDITPQSILVFN